MNGTEPEPSLSQSDKFKDLARQIGADEDEAHWEERLRKVAQQKPAPEPETAADADARRRP